MKWAIPRLFAALFALATLAGCDSPQPPPAKTLPPQPQQRQIDAADTIFVGGDIVTINDKQPSAEALAIKGGRIIAVGARSDVEMAHKGAGTQVVDLGDKTLMPGFIDAHSHYINALSVANQVKLYAPPGRAGQGCREHRRRAQEVRPRPNDPQGRNDHGLRL